MYKVSEEVAVQELREFYSKHNRKPISDEKLMEAYPDVVEAIKLGDLALSGEKPILKLSEPILNLDNEVSLAEVVFKTRILPSEQRSIARNIDLNVNGALYGHKCVAFIIDQPLAMLDKISRGDYKTVEQLSTLFI